MKGVWGVALMIVMEGSFRYVDLIDLVKMAVIYFLAL
jgi:hypothetical protein